MSPMPWEEVVATLTAPGAPFEMEEVDVRGVTVRIFVHMPHSLRTIAEGLADHGDADHIVYLDERSTFAEVAARVRSLAHHLVGDLGVEPGDRVAIAARNLPEWPVTFWATVAVGAIAVPLNAWWTADELRYGLEHSGARVLIADDERLERLAGGPLPPTVLAVRSDRGAPLADLLGDDPGALPDASIDPDDDATIFYTSGTTGRPKGAVGSHRNMLTNLISVRWRLASMALADGSDPSPEPAGQKAILLSVPLFHVTGAHSVMLPAAAGGMKLVMQHRWDPDEAARLVEAERITAFTGVPTMAWELLRSEEAARRDLSSLTYVGAGGAPSPPELVRLVADRVGCPAGNGYGMTETSALAVVNAGEGYRDDPGSIGRPVPCNDVRIVASDVVPAGPLEQRSESPARSATSEQASMASDVGPAGFTGDRSGSAAGPATSEQTSTASDVGPAGTDEEAPDGTPGELWVRGPCVVRGYWNDPAATEAAFGGGWMRTGDVAVRQPDGRLRIVDRLKDIVIRGGENISTVEVEAALYEHPAVHQAAVFGRPDERLGERVAAVVVPRPGTAPTPDELRDHVAERLAAFKVPEVIEVRAEELPTNAAGKFLKRELRS